MKNKPLVIERQSQTKIPDWLYQQEEEDDFLLGKTPREFQDMWEDEE